MFKLKEITNFNFVKQILSFFGPNLTCNSHCVWSACYSETEDDRPEGLNYTLQEKKNKPPVV